MGLELDRADVEREVDGFEFPERFDFGASTAGYQVEGGFNGPADPKNNWFWAEERGEKARTGSCARFMEMHREDFRRCSWMGLNAFRMGIEWARLQPGVDPVLASPQPFSKDAAAQYARIMADCFDNGMFPAVTLFHWTHPLWAGMDLWLDGPLVRELFGAYVEFAVTQINRALVAMGKPPIPYFITMNEPICMPMTAYRLGVFPKGPRKGWQETMDCYENILAAHVRSYRTIHRIYRENGWPRPVMTVNNWCSAAYGMDKFSQDLFLARRNGVARSEVPAFLADQRARFQAHLRSVPYLRGPQFVKRAIDARLERKFMEKLGPEPMPALCDLVYEGDDPNLIDVLGFDYYDSFIANNLDFEFPRLVRLRTKPWEWNVNPKVLGVFLESYSWTAKGLPIHILEHGMCHRGVSGKAWPHPNGVTRDEELKLIMLEVVRALRKGVDLRAFFYWSLMDNYEWGSFEPRFGLFGVDYENGARRLSTDIFGTNAAGSYRLFIEAFRARDKSALKKAFLANDYPRWVE